MTPESLHALGLYALSSTIAEQRYATPDTAAGVWLEFRDMSAARSLVTGSYKVRLRQWTPAAAGKPGRYTEGPWIPVRDIDHLTMLVTTWRLTGELE